MDFIGYTDPPSRQKKYIIVHILFVQVGQSEGSQGNNRRKSNRVLKGEHLLQIWFPN